VLLVLDGLGWEQLQARRNLAPTLSSMAGGPVVSVVPSTTSTALTSITTGAPPARHGVMGYRMMLDGDVVNVLRWRGSNGEPTIAPEQVQPVSPFAGTPVPVITRAEFDAGGFTRAHLRGSQLAGWRMPSTLIGRVADAVASGARFVYAYYDGVDKVAHEFGLGEMYDREVAAADRLVADILGVLPAGWVLAVTADHGQVDVGDALVAIDDDVLRHTRVTSGEGRFRWLHAKPGHEVALAEAAREHHGHHAWVRTRAEAEAEGWFGGPVGEFAARIGDVLLAARDPIGFTEAHDGESTLRSRHGSLTAAEMLVPLVACAPDIG
jgi:predicted AlkP superfamily pyrophosphatase or phosphodiesterase